MGEWMGVWVGGWMDGWTDERALLRGPITASNARDVLTNTKSRTWPLRVAGPSLVLGVRVLPKEVP